MTGTTTHFERWTFWGSLLLVLACFFLPLFWIWHWHSTFSEHELRQTGEATVGIAVILRATARRLLRSGSSNILRTTLGAYSRAVGRAMTRRIVKMSMRVVAGSVARQVVDAEQGDEEGGKRGNGVLALAVGSAGLALSFWGILHVVGEEEAAQFTTDRGLSTLVLALLAAVPLVVYAVVNTAAGRAFGVEVRMRSEFDGLLLQGYFTGAGSFLPMTTDFEYHGNERGKAGVAAIALGTLYVLHLLLGWIGAGSPALVFLSTMFLVYVFVYSFPIKPLEGYDIWSRSKLLWVLFWAPILWSFMVSLPEEFAVIL